MGIVRRSSSPWSSPLHFNHKPSVGWHQSRAGVLRMYLITSTSTFHHERWPGKRSFRRLSKSGILQYGYSSFSFHVTSSSFGFFPSGVATADFPFPVVPIVCILLRHFNLSHVLFHHIHKPPFWPSPFPLSW